MTNVHFEDNSPKVLAALEEAIGRILETWGQMVETWAKALCPVGTPESTGKKGYIGGTLKNSITHKVVMLLHSVFIGTNVIYGPYVELGTGPYFVPPPEWEQFESKRGSGKGHGYVHPRPFLQPAITDHPGDLKDAAEDILKSVDI